MKYLWTEDTGAELHFWKLVNQLFFDDALVVESKESNQGLLDALTEIDIKEDDKYYISFDYVVDNQDIRNKYRMLKSIADKAEGKIIILDMICFEYLILAFDKLVAWTGTGKIDKIKIREEVLSAIENHRINLSKIDDEKTLQYLAGFKRYSTERVMKSLMGEFTQNEKWSVRLSDQDKLKIEKEYSHFFEALKEISDINDIINWQETSELKGAKKFFSHINILPNMPPMQSILSSVRLGYSEEELSMQGLGHRNLVLLFVLINSLLGKETDIALNVLTIEEPEAHLCINNTRLMVSFLKAFTDKNKTVQLFYSTHSTEFINKMNLKNVVVLHNGKAYSFADELEDEDFAYLAKNPNLDLFKLFFSKKCILFEGISEELLIRSYIDSKETLSDIEVLSFHKGFKKIMNIWKKVNEGSDNKLGIIRDYDNQSNAKKQHDKYNDDKEICVRTTEYYTLEPEIVNTGDNYKILKNKYGDVFGWNDMTDDQLTEAWKNAKATDMFTICKDLASGELEGFQMPKHIQDVIDFLSQESEEVL